MESSNFFNPTYLYSTAIPQPLMNPFSYMPIFPQLPTFPLMNDPFSTMTAPYFNNVLALTAIQNSKLLMMNTKPSTATAAVSTSTTCSATGSTPTPHSNDSLKQSQQPLGFVDKYVLLSELGQDHLYPVYLAASIFDMPPYDQANLVVLKAIPATDYRKSFENESNIFQLKYHKHLLRCTEIIKNARFLFNDSVKKTTESTKPRPGDGYYHILVLKYHANGDFLDFVKKRRLEERVARYYFGQLLDALEHLHTHGYCHRDLKIENILVDQNYDLVLTDFGHSVKYKDQNGDKVFIEESCITTPGICPPEFHKGFGYKGVPMDVFALGKLLLIFVTGFNPFKNAKETDQNYAMILKGQWDAYWRLTMTWMKKKWVKADPFSKDLKSLLESMLSPDPSKRPSIQQIRESAWYKKTPAATSEEVKIAMIRAKNQI